MINRKALKKEAQKNLKKHYIVFVFICLISAFIGAEFRGSLILTDGIEQNLFSQLANKVYPEIQNNIDTHIGNEVINNINEKIEIVASSDITKTITDTTKPINDNIKSIQEKTLNNTESIKGSKGVFANIINSISSNDFILTLTKGILSIIDSESTSYLIAIIITIIIWLSLTVFVIEFFKIITRRLFLEGRIYKYIPTSHCLYLFRSKRAIKASFSLFITNFKEILWSFTIIMLPIKHYEYLMVPYIIAENPSIDSKEAIKISKKLMYGKKWSAFVLDLSFLGYHLIGYLTLGLFNIFFTNPYKMSTYVNLYSTLRKDAINNDENLSTHLNDTYLFEKPEEVLINSAYNDIKKYEGNLKEPTLKLNKINKLLLSFLGINTLPKEETIKYESYMIDSFKIAEYSEEMQTLSYPTRLSDLNYKSNKPKRIDSVNYLKPYKISSLIAMFFIMCFIGYTWEVILNIITTGEFVNKGMLHGPWLPIYGSGGILILTVLYKLRKKPKLEFLATLTLCGTVEYLTGSLLEVIFNRKEMVGLYWLFS